MAALYWITAILVRYLVSQKRIVLELLFSLVAFYLLWGLKYYWAILYATVAITTLTIFLLKKKSTIKTSFLLGIWLLIFIFIIALASLTHPNFYVHRLLQVVVDNNQQFVNLSKPGSYISYVDLQATWWSLCSNAPVALFSALFRPFVWEANGLMGWLAAIENLFLTILFLGWTLSRRKLPWDVLLPIFAYSAALAIFLALSTPNLGTLSRYRIGFLPFFVFALSAYSLDINYLFRKRSDLSK